MSERPSLTQAQLDQFTGSETWWRHPLNRRVTFTDGVRFLAEQAGAYWLIDEILLIQPKAAKLGLPDWQFWRLTVHADKSATLLCHDGDGVIAYAKEIGWTDFPLNRVELWFTNDVLYLPSEH